MKRIISIVLSLLMFTSLTLTAFAEPELDTPVNEEIIEEYSYTQRVSSTLSISNKIANCKSTVFGFSTLATKIVMTQTLQKKNGNSWTNVTSWSKTFNTWYGVFKTQSRHFQVEHIG